MPIQNEKPIEEKRGFIEREGWILAVLLIAVGAAFCIFYASQAKEKITAVEKQCEEKVSAAQVECDTKIATVEKQCEEKVSAAQEEYDTKITAVEKQCEEKVSAAQAECDTKIADVEKTCKEQLTKAENERADALRVYNETLQKLWKAEDNYKSAVKESDKWRARVVELETSKSQ
jgi:hypothetical protein